MGLSTKRFYGCSGYGLKQVPDDLPSSKKLGQIHIYNGRHNIDMGVRDLRPSCQLCECANGQVDSKRKATVATARPQHASSSQQRADEVGPQLETTATTDHDTASWLIAYTTVLHLRSPPSRATGGVNTAVIWAIIQNRRGASYFFLFCL